MILLGFGLFLPIFGQFLAILFDFRPFFYVLPDFFILFHWPGQWLSKKV